MTPAVIVAGSLDDPRLAIALIADRLRRASGVVDDGFHDGDRSLSEPMMGSVSGFGGFVAGIVSIAVAEIDRPRAGLPTRRCTCPSSSQRVMIYPLALGVFHLLSRKWSWRASHRAGWWRRPG